MMTKRDRPFSWWQLRWTDTGERPRWLCALLAGIFFVDGLRAVYDGEVWTAALFLVTAGFNLGMWGRQDAQERRLGREAAMKFVWKKQRCIYEVGVDYALRATDDDFDIGVALCVRNAGAGPFKFVAGSTDLYGESQIYPDGETLIDVMREIETDCLLEQKCRAIREGDRNAIQSTPRDSNAVEFQDVQ